MIWRIRDRATFQSLRASGVRARQGPIGITFLPDPPIGGPGQPRLAFAIGKRVGHAVERNKLRRRIRSVFVELDRDGLPAGAYLVTAQAGAPSLSFLELREHVQRALTRINHRVASAASAEATSTGSR